MKKVLSCEKYQKNGEEKTSYKEIGNIFTNANGNEFLKLYFLPSQVFLIKENEQRQSTNQTEEVPF